LRSAWVQFPPILRFFHSIIESRVLSFVFSHIETRKGDWIHDVAVDSVTDAEFHRRMAKPDHPHF